MIVLPNLRQPVGPVTVNRSSLLDRCTGLWRFQNTPINLITGEPTALTGTAYYGVGPRGQIGRTVAGGANRIQLAADSSTLVSTNGNLTVFLHYRKIGAAAATAGFGLDSSADGSRRCGTHFPFSDGTVYWDYGGNTAGVNRLTAAGLTFTDDFWCFTVGPRGMEIWQNGILRASNAATPTRSGTTLPYLLGMHGTATAPDDAECAMFLVAQRQWAPAEIVRCFDDPWYVFSPQTVYIKAAAAQAPSGAGNDALQSIVDTSTGRTGAVGRVVDAFQSLAESAYGFTSVNASGFANDALQALVDTSTGRTGAVGIDRDAFQSIVDNAGGVAQTTARIGFAAEAFQSIAETSTGRTGVVGRDVDALQPLQEAGRGITGAAGLGLDSIQPLQDLGFGESGAEPIVVKRGGAPAWWGYEGFDGTKRPWWYKDLKDKAKELERQRQLRIDLGILPPDEDKAIQKVLKETKAFVEKTPTPKNAEQMIAKYDAISSKLELLVDQMEEEEDEQAIMQMSKFFFHRKTEARAY